MTFEIRVLLMKLGQLFAVTLVPCLLLWTGLVSRSFDDAQSARNSEFDEHLMSFRIAVFNFVGRKV